MAKKPRTDKIIQDLTKPPRKAPGPPWAKGLSTGCTLLNLAITGRPGVGVLPGSYTWLIGDSHSGKTWLAMSVLAEAAARADYDGYRFIYDSAENGAKMDRERFFGAKLAGRLEAPQYDGDLPLFSETVEEFYMNLDYALNGGPCIYVLDSMDAISSEADEDKFAEAKEAFSKGKRPEAGSYGTGKAKANSNNMRRAYINVTKSKSILIVISQTRDTIGFGSQFNPKSVSGGKSLKFYADAMVWLSVREKLKGTKRGKPVTLGIKAQANVDKSRWHGQSHKVEFPIRWNYGLDDLTSMIDWLVDWNVWKKGDKGRVTWEAQGLAGTADGLVAQIEEQGLEKALRQEVADAWDDIIESCNTGRKKRYE